MIAKETGIDGYMCLSVDTCGSTMLKRFNQKPFDFHHRHYILLHCMEIDCYQLLKDFTAFKTSSNEMSQDFVANKHSTQQRHLRSTIESPLNIRLPGALLFLLLHED